MNELQVTARFQVHDGKIEAFKGLARQCIASVREKDSGTLQYDWFFNLDETECVVRERYRDSDALLEHIGNLGGLLGSLREVGDFLVEIYGLPSAALLEATAGLDQKVYGFFEGI